MIIQGKSTYRTQITSGIHGMAHHGITAYSDGGVALHRSSGNAIVGHIAGSGWRGFNHTVATTVHVTHGDSGDLTISRIVTFCHGEFPTHSTPLDGDGGVSCHLSHLTATIHVAIDENLCRSHAATKQHGQHKECFPVHFQGAYVKYSFENHHYIVCLLILTIWLSSSLSLMR